MRHRHFASGLSHRLFAAIIVLLFGVAAAKPRKSKVNTGPKVYWKKETECAKSVCKNIHPDENEDCVTRCVSELCYNEVYQGDPVEPGEIDRARQGKFNTCVKRVQEEDRKLEKSRGAVAQSFAEMREEEAKKP
mmetsp:Transcript_12148/g.28348  ORF Transcript_12148/g.28348 Transcript_12148/m.28348 type:complete len:134 (-) Transcript_12148:50-451(-)